MDDKEWRTFVTVVDEGNITKAAEKLFVSQPALSYRLRHLEDSVGYSLLLRTTEGIALTPQGEIYYDYCKRMLHDREALEHALTSSTGKIQGTLKIASSINFGYTVYFLFSSSSVTSQNDFSCLSSAAAAFNCFATAFASFSVK